MRGKKALSDWLPFVFLAWVALILAVCHRASLADLPAKWDFFTGGLGTHFFEFWSGQFFFMLESGAFLAGCWAVGRSLGRASFSRGEKGGALFALALGLGVMAYAAFAILAVGFHARAVMRAVALAVSILGAAALPREASRAKRSAAPRPGGRRDFLPVLLLAYVGLAFGLNLLLNAIPETNFDALEYHLAIPQAYLQEGRIVDLPHNCFSKLPLLMSMVYAWALAMGGGVLDGMYLAKWLNFFLGLSVAAAVYFAGKKLKDSRAGIFAAALFLSLPMISNLFMIATTDMACVFFVSMSLSAFWLWHEDEKAKGLLWLAGLLGGFALATKYVAVFGLAPLWLALAYKRRSGLTLLKFTGLLLLPLLPWWAQNALSGYSPFFPVIGGPSAEAVRGTVFQPGPAVEFLKQSLVYSRDPSHLLGPLFLAAAPLVLWEIRDKKIRVGLAYFLSVVALGSTVTLNLRFFAQVFPVATLLIALSVERLEPERKEWRGILYYSALLAVCSLNLGWSAVRLLALGTNGLLVSAGRATPSEYLKSPRTLYPFPSYGAYEAVDRLRLSERQRVLIVGDPRAFYCAHRSIANSGYDESPILAWARASRTPEDLVARMDGAGIAVIVLNQPEFIQKVLDPREHQRVLGIIQEASDRFFRKYHQDAFTVVLLRKASDDRPDKARM